MASGGPPESRTGGVEPPVPPPPHTLAVSPTPPPIPPPSKSRGLPHRVFVGATNAVGRTLRVGGKVGGLVAAVTLATYYYQSSQVDEYFGPAVAPDDDDDDNKPPQNRKRVLVLPFDNLKVVELKKNNVDDLLRRTAQGQGNKQPTITIEAKELIQIIHHAASDPTISALYADFGEGMRHPMGYAHTEEISNAVRIFNESHRTHRDPNVNHNPVFAMMRNGDPKPTYAFGYGFQWSEYFLASAFSYVHLQARGNLSLFGHVGMNTFVRGALDKYGVKAHVFRHGKYKNAPSIFTDKAYSKAHLESVQSMTASLNNSVCTRIENSRALSFDSVMWQSIFDYGSLESSNAVEIGLVDSIPPVDPLISLVDITKHRHFIKKKNKDRKEDEETPASIWDGISENLSKSAAKRLEEFEGKFGLHESFSKFPATEATSLEEYRIMLKKKQAIEEVRKQAYRVLQNLAATSSATAMILGIQPDGTSVNSDKVAVLTVDGSINGALSYEIIRSLRRIRKDPQIKAVVLRVNSPGGGVVSSEAMLEEIKLLEMPVICSMSNFAASGGYYISMNCEKIFAQSTTLTGSIGIFGIKFDASKFANSYGITSDYYPRGSHAAAIHPLTPLTPATKESIDRYILDFYDYFKRVVGNGRSLSEDEVEKVAQGRVWTGELAKEVGLVDALGGLNRAISYAKTTHTKTEHVEIEHWPKTAGLMDLLGGGQKQLGVDTVHALLAAVVGQDGSVKHESSAEQLLSALTELKFAEKPHVMLTMDEETALDIIIRGE